MLPWVGLQSAGLMMTVIDPEIARNLTSAKTFMNKFLVIVDAQATSVDTIQFACFVGRVTQSRMTGVFLDTPLIQEEITIAETENANVIIETVSVQSAGAANDQAKEDAIRFFQHTADTQNVLYHLDIGENYSLAEIIQKTFFADLLIADAKTFMTESDDAVPNSLIKHLLQEAQCPVILTPAEFTDTDTINHIVFFYRGIKSSVFAVKQFLYLFPALRNKKATIINLYEEQNGSAQEEKLFVHWLKEHFTSVELISHDSYDLASFLNRLSKNKTSLVVMGAYGKGLLSAFFSPDVKKEVAPSLPIFIAHY